MTTNEIAAQLITRWCNAFWVGRFKGHTSIRVDSTADNPVATTLALDRFISVGFTVTYEGTWAIIRHDPKRTLKSYLEQFWITTKANNGEENESI